LLHNWRARINGPREKRTPNAFPTNIMMLIESDTDRRQILGAALRASGNDVTAVAWTGEIIAWPTGEAVVVESSSFSPWWKHVGATQVVVLADTRAEGMDACARGATAWVPRECAPGVLIAALALEGRA
jgi:hypothetical protein